MPFRSRSIGREMATAFAVLAIYLLTLLLPLHQAAGLQRDLSRIGFTTTGWSICTPIAQDDNSGGAPTAVKCPANGVVKFDLAAILPPSIVIALVRVAEPVVYAGVVSFTPLPTHPHASQPRAPPVMA
jgi:hypothetical protein